MTDILIHIHESNLIEGYNSELADQQSLEAWEYLRGQTRLTHSVIRNVQKLIVRHQDDLKDKWRGNYRDIAVYIGYAKAMDYWDIQPALDGFLMTMRDMTPKDAHVRFEKIHPFVDGNGRTGRMIMWWHELQLGLEPTLILDSQKQFYYQWFRNYAV